jgi:DNA-binding CsgD family transcriptional regulator
MNANIPLQSAPSARRGHGEHIQRHARGARVNRYGLTPAERRVAVLIGAGHSPREIAAQLGISFHTVRAHLRSTYAKTGVKRQTALARLLWEES